MGAGMTTTSGQGFSAVTGSLSEWNKFDKRSNAENEAARLAALRESNSRYLTQQVFDDITRLRRML